LQQGVGCGGGRGFAHVAHPSDITTVFNMPTDSGAGGQDKLGKGPCTNTTRKSGKLWCSAFGGSEKRGASGKKKKGGGGGVVFGFEGVKRDISGWQKRVKKIKYVQ